MPRALFVASNQGLGHVTRCHALMAELAPRGVRCSLVNDLPNSLASVDVVVMDPWYAIAPFETTKCRVVGILDEPRDVGNTDLAVYGGAARLRPEDFPYAKRLLIGPDYALLRPEFRSVRWGQNGFSSSHDVYDLRTVERESAFSLSRNIAASRIVVTYGGMRAMEAACVGAPMVVVARNEGELLNAIAMAGRYAFYEPSAEYADRWPRVLLKETERLRAMSAACHTLVDGLGCSRVATAIMELLG